MQSRRTRVFTGFFAYKNEKMSAGKTRKSHSRRRTGSKHSPPLKNEKKSAASAKARIFKGLRGVLKNERRSFGKEVLATPSEPRFCRENEVQKREKVSGSEMLHTEAARNAPAARPEVSFALPPGGLSLRFT